MSKAKIPETVPELPKQTKLELIIALLSRPEGATSAEMLAATSWQPHTLRGALSGALRKKRGLVIVSDKPKDGERIYKIARTPSNKPKYIKD